MYLTVLGRLTGSERRSRAWGPGQDTACIPLSALSKPTYFLLAGQPAAPLSPQRLLTCLWEVARLEPGPLPRRRAPLLAGAAHRPLWSRGPLKGSLGSGSLRWGGLGSRLRLAVPGRLSRGRHQPGRCSPPCQPPLGLPVRGRPPPGTPLLSWGAPPGPPARRNSTAGLRRRTGIPGLCRALARAGAPRRAPPSAPRARCARAPAGISGSNTSGPPFPRPQTSAGGPLTEEVLPALFLHTLSAPYAHTPPTPTRLRRRLLPQAPPLHSPAPPLTTLPPHIPLHSSELLSSPPRPASSQLGPAPHSIPLAADIFLVYIYLSRAAALVGERAGAGGGPAFWPAIGRGRYLWLSILLPSLAPPRRRSVAGRRAAGTAGTGPRWPAFSALVVSAAPILIHCRAAERRREPARGVRRLSPWGGRPPWRPWIS